MRLPISISRGALLCTSLFIALHAPHAAAAGCMAASHPAQVEDRLTDAEAALQAADSDAFETAMEEVSLLVPCLAEALPTQTASQLHRLTGVQSYDAGNSTAAAPAFLAARVLDPAYHFPESEFSADHPIRTTYDGLSASSARDKKAPEPKSGALYFDGRETRERPANRNTVVQLLNASSQVTETAYLLPDQPLPTYPAVPHLRNSLLLSSAIALVGSAACYGGSWAAHGKFEADDPTYALSDLKAFKGTANVLLGASITLGAVAVGGGTGALLVGAR